MGNPVVHFEINGPDAEGTAKFYSDLFGWHTESQMMGEINYLTIDTHAGGGINGGFGEPPDGSSYVTFYVEVDDLQASLDKAESLGGKTVMPPFEIPNVVSFAQFADPDGNVVGLVKSGEGPGVSAGKNPAVGWFEILGRGGEGLQKFYADLFDWNIKPSGMEGIVYGEVDTGTDRGIPGGVGGSPTGQPQVALYASVDHVGNYLDKAVKLGAKTLMEPTKMSDNTKVALFADLKGRAFGLFKVTR